MSKKEKAAIVCLFTTTTTILADLWWFCWLLFNHWRDWWGFPLAVTGCLLFSFAGFLVISEWNKDT